MHFIYRKSTTMRSFHIIHHTFEINQFLEKSFFHLSNWYFEASQVCPFKHIN